MYASLLSYRTFFYYNMIEISTRTIVAGIFAVILLTASVTSTHNVSAATSSTGIMIPLYSYPGSYWTQVIQAKNAHPSVPFVVIINPDNGPGSSSDSTYVSSVQQMQSAGIVVLGYVATGYGSNSQSGEESQINSYISWYHVNGIFFDEMANVSGLETYYSTLNNYAHNHGLTLTVGNPGTDTLSSYIGTMDNLVIYENPGLPTLSDLGGWHTSYSKSNFSMIAFGVSLPSQSYITSITPDVSYVYVTNDNLPNPYDSVPSYLGSLAGELDSGSTSTAPGSPTGLTATAVSSSQINLSWTAPSNNGGSVITGYKIDDSTNGGSTWSTIVANTGSAATTYSHTGLTQSTTYTYRVEAINSVGVGASSITVSATPIGSTVTLSVNSLDLSGNAIPGMWVELHASDGTTLATGYTPITFNVNTGVQYTVNVADYQNTTFNHWDNGSTSASRNVTVTQNTSLIAYYSTSIISNGIVLNNVQTTSGTTSSNKLTISNFNMGIVSNGLLVIGVSANNNNVASVTFGGVKLTKAVSSFNNNDAEFWFLKNPSGTANIVVTMSGSTQVVIGAYSFSGINQSNPIVTKVTAHNSTPNSPTITVKTKYSNDWVLDLPSIYGGVTLGSPSCAKHWDVNVPNAITGASSSTMVSSPTTVSCKWIASSSELWDDVAIELRSN